MQTFRNHFEITIQLIAYSMILFITCMILHGELAIRKPTPKYLTKYYLLISTGGALGGIFVGIIAPLIFNAYLELPLTFLGCFLLIATTIVLNKDSTSYYKQNYQLTLIFFFLFIILSTNFFVYFKDFYSSPILTKRNFYGILRVVENESKISEKNNILLYNGGILHGFQTQNEKERFLPTSYYTETSGLGLAFALFDSSNATRIGSVGLGTGTIAVYGDSNDYLRIYEIDSDVEIIAREYFDYLNHFPGQLDIVINDARLALEQEEPQNFDLLILDAFSSDAIPAHLLTKEAFEIYLKHMNNPGIIAVHISNRHLNLQYVVWRLGQQFNMPTYLIDDNPEIDRASNSNWVIMSNNDNLLNNTTISERGQLAPENFNFPLWTDNHSNIFKILK